MTRHTVAPTVAATILLLLASSEAAIGQEKELIERGRLIYRIHCINCHGDNGRGDGPLVEVMKIQPADLTAISRRRGGRFPFEDVYRIIDGRSEVSGHGARKMPIWGLAFQDPGSDASQEDQVRGRILQLIRYLRSIQEPPEKESATAASNGGGDPAP
ncbi:MAG: cytochrome c [Acidobacteriota bacterium]|nr:cytochrome c [Acidobacteriota bacterium]